MSNFTILGQTPAERQSQLLQQLAQQGNPAVNPGSPQQKGLFGVQQLRNVFEQRKAERDADAQQTIVTRNRHQVQRDNPELPDELAMIQALKQAANEISDPTDAATLYRQALDLANAREVRQAELSKLQAQAASSSNADIDRTRKLEDSLRKETDAQLADTKVVIDKVAQLEAVIQQGTAPSDLSAIFLFMKVLDPSSVVRESEFRTVEEARQGILSFLSGNEDAGIKMDRLTTEGRARLAAMASNERFTDFGRAQIVNAARATAAEQAAQSKVIVEDAQDTARRRGQDVESVTSGLMKQVLGTIDGTQFGEVDAMRILNEGISLHELLNPNAITAEDRALFESLGL